MKSIFLQTQITVLLLLTLVMSSHFLSAQVKRVATYNVRFDNPKDGENRWDTRKEELVSLLDYYSPDVIGTQEALKHQLDFMDSNLIGYQRVGVGRDDGKTKGEYCAIYFRSNVLEIITSSTFWLSESPDSVSVGWDASMERICTYGLFQNKESGKRVWVFNAHFDHVGAQARAMSARLIIRKIKEINAENDPVVLMGDFNAEPESMPIQLFNQVLTDGATVTKKGIYGPSGTFTGFNKMNNADRRIDYVFVQGLTVTKYRHVDDKRKNGNYVSDHLPVIVDFE